MKLNIPSVTWMRHYCCVFIGGAALLLIQGCAGTPSKHVAAPSTMGSNRAIAGARQSNQQAQRYNDLSRTDAELIEAKGNVVKKYWGK